MSILKKATAFCLCLLLVFSCIPAVAAGSFEGITGPTLVKRDGIWYYIKDEAVCKDTTLIKFSGSWYFVKDGTTHPEYTSLVKYNGSWWYVKNGKVASGTTGLVKWNGEWWYVKNGKVASNTTDLIKWNNEWWYIVKGKVASNTTTLVKYNGGWYYIYKGKLAAKTTTLFKYNGSWYYVENGKVNFSKTTLVKYSGTWYYVTAGKLTRTTCFCSYANHKYYVQNGVAKTTLSGRVTVDGSVYYIKNGVMTDCHIVGHDFIPATCTAAQTCSKCTITIGEAVGHSYNVEYTPGNCITEGCFTHTCRSCGYSYVGEKTGYGAHQWSDWEWVNPSCTVDGYKSRTCICGAAQWVDLGSAYGHYYYLSGEQDGKLVYSCVHCGDCYYERTNTRYDATAPVPEVVMTEYTDCYIGINCRMNFEPDGTRGFECIVSRDANFNAGIKTAQTDHEWNGLGFAKMSFFYADGYKYYKVRSYRMEGDVFVYGPWSEPVEMEYRCFDIKGSGTAEYSYELYFLDDLGTDIFSRADKAVYIKTNNPNGGSIRLMAGGECATSNYVGGYEYNDVTYLDFADAEEAVRKVKGGYVAILNIDNPGATTLELWEGHADGYVVGKSIAVNVIDYDTYCDQWIDDMIAARTTKNMTSLEKMEAVCDWLSNGQFRYLTNQNEYMLRLAAQPNNPWFLTKRWDSCTSPAMLERIAQRIGGFEEVHDCFADYPRGTNEWYIYHHQTYVVYQGKTHYFSVCPTVETGEVEYEVIDFSDVSQFTRFG